MKDKFEDDYVKLEAKDFQKMYINIEAHMQISNLKKDEKTVLQMFLDKIKESQEKGDELLLIEEKDAIVLGQILGGS